MSNVIAIDGPSGAGKSSVSKIVGQKLGYLHVDSGALYRIMTWQCLENGVDTSDPAAVAAFAATVEVTCRPEDGMIAYYVKGEKPGNRIRTPEINAHASPVATVKEVRDRITAILRGLTAQGDLVVEGRDITTAVFPDTPARFYLTASAEARARRRQKEEIEKGIANQSEEAGPRLRGLSLRSASRTSPRFWRVDATASPGVASRRAICRAISLRRFSRRWC